MTMQPDRPWETDADESRREQIRKNDAGMNALLFVTFGLFFAFLLGLAVLLIGG